MELPDVDEEVLDRVSRHCLSLPETTLRSDRWAHAFQVRRNVFTYLFAIDDPAGRPVTMLVCRADPEERLALVAGGHPYFAPNSGTDRIGIVLDAETDWTEVAELVTESYRLLAPKKLAALLDE